MGKKTPQTATFFTVFVKFSRRVPNPVNINDAVREMCSNVMNVRKPRQKSARWILVDFETMEQAEEFKKLLQTKKLISTIPVKTNKLTVKQNDPMKSESTERQEYKNALTKQTFKSKMLEKYSNKLMVSNLPEKVTLNDLRTLFPHNQKIDLKNSSNKAIIHYSSAKEAMENRMSVRPVLNDQKLRVIILLLNSEASSSDKKE